VGADHALLDLGCGSDLSEALLDLGCGIIILASLKSDKGRQSA
jgi:hypothetical protein